MHHRISLVIQSIKDKRTKKIYELKGVGRIPPESQLLALRKLRILDNAVNLNDLRVPPTNELRRLLGKRVGQYGIRIDEHWRVCFDWVDGQAHNVEIADYKRK